MPAPTTCDELVDLIRRSGVVEEPKLQSYLQKLTADSNWPTDPSKLAGLLVRDGILTYFQAEQLLQGKYKRFNLGKYKVLEKLGSGGMAQVFLCEHKLMRRRVAIKVLPIPKADDPSSLARFYREARVIAAVDHPNIVRAYDIDQDENLHFLVMEYVDGTNLQELVKKFGPLDFLRACHYIYGAAVGLQHAHELGLVHRDIKPGNILIDRSGVVKILDMGLARFFHDEEDNLTRMNDENVLGTADYLAPEQALDSHTVDIRADIYSLGATFYYLLTGSPPFPEGSVAQKLIWHQNRQPRPIASLRPDTPEPLIAIIDRMMAKDPAQRYQTPAEVMAALASWVTTPIPPPTERELPQLSPAASGGMARTSAPIVPIPAASTTPPLSITQKEVPVATFSSSRTEPATSQKVQGSVAPTLTANATTQATPIWESLSTDTQPLGQTDTDRTSIPSHASIRSTRASAQVRSNRRVLYLVLGLLGLLGCGFGIYFGFISRRGPSPQSAPPPLTTRQPIIVSKSGGENAVPTLREALSKATAGDTILIREPRLIEPKLTLDRIRHQNLTIESATSEGKPAVIEAAGVSQTMLDATNVEGFRIRNLEFDGSNKADIGIQVSGFCPGGEIENVTVRNVKTTAIRLLNAAGESGRPIVLDQVRSILSQNQVGVLISSSANIETRHVTIQRSRFEGPGRAGLRIDGATQAVTITGNRFFGNEVAITLPKVSANKPLVVAFKSNTIFQTKTGIQLDFTEGEQLGQLNVVLVQNYFGQTPALATINVASAAGTPPPPIGPIPGIKSADNAYDPASLPGNYPLQATLLPSPVLTSLDPNDNATFLRFPAGPPEVGMNRVKVGAP
jgi:serine/threonine protein kinase